MEKLMIKNGGILSTKNCDYYDVYLLMIDTEEKTIDVSDNTGFSIGLIHYKDEKEISLYKYDDEGKLGDDDVMIIKNGEFLWQQ